MSTVPKRNVFLSKLPAQPYTLSKSYSRKIDQTNTHILENASQLLKLLYLFFQTLHRVRHLIIIGQPIRLVLYRNHSLHCVSNLRQCFFGMFGSEEDSQSQPASNLS